MGRKRRRAIKFDRMLAKEFGSKEAAQRVRRLEKETGPKQRRPKGQR